MSTTRRDGAVSTGVARADADFVLGWLRQVDAPDNIVRLQERVSETLARQVCRACGGIGAIEGFWLGTTKTCPACHGSGRQ